MEDWVDFFLTACDKDFITSKESVGFMERELEAISIS
jgi:hypothetical protein